jgi:competence/damage-inducible protein CinA-like protein
VPAGARDLGARDELDLSLRLTAAVVITGSELVRGDRTDLNGPFLARELVSLGLDPSRIVIVGDGRAELEAALRDGLRADLCVVSGGLGPTHDDRTVEVLATVAGIDLVVDEALAQEIEAVSRGIAERLRRPYADFEPGVRKQATLPRGALCIGLAGTAPGFVLESMQTAVIVLPGPPAELRKLWPEALHSEPVRRVLARATPPGRQVLRFYGASESAVAQALADAGGDGHGVEATVCARDFEIHVDLVVAPGAEVRAATLAAALRVPLEPYFFSAETRPIEELVLGLCRSRSLTLATAESCTGGMVAARLTSVPGSSDVFRGSVVAYADDVKQSELSVPADILARHGAVSAETAAVMAAGVRRRLQADVGVAVTGIAGPGGGSREKPVGLVHLHVESPTGGRGVEFNFPGDRDTIRRRAAAGALHLVRRLLTQTRDEPA